MPRAHRGRFEPFDHFVLGHLSILAPLSAPWVVARGETVHWFSYRVRRKDGASSITHRSHEHRATLARMKPTQLLPVVLALLLGALLLWLTLAWLLDPITLPVS